MDSEKEVKKPEDTKPVEVKPKGVPIAKTGAPVTPSIGYGFVLSNSATSGGTYTPVAAIEDLKPARTTVEKYKIMRNDSPTLYGETFPSWFDGGEYEVKVTWDKVSYGTLFALTGVTQFWKFIRPNGTTTSAFSGFVSEFSDEVPLNKNMTYSFKITLNGGQTYTA